MNNLFSQKPQKPLAVSDLLGTKNQTEQVQQIQRLMAPVVTIVTQADLRNGSIRLDVMGMDNPPVQLLVDILRQAEDQIRQRQIQDAAPAPKQPAQAETELADGKADA